MLKDRTFTDERLQGAMRVFPRVRDVYEATTRSDGDSSTFIRNCIIAYATDPAPENLQCLPEAIRDYVRKVVEESHKIVDRDIENLKNCGFSEDFIFEITVTASLGAGLRRFRAGIEAIS